MCLAKVQTIIDRLSIKSDLFDKIKWDFFQAAVVLILLYGCTSWMLTKCIEKKLDENCTRMLQAILNKFWKYHCTKPQLYGHLPPIFKTIRVRWRRHTGHYWRSKDKLISDILQWTSIHSHNSLGWTARTYLQQPWMNTGCSLEELPDNREEW